MSFDLFDHTQYLEQGLSAAWLRNQVIANNIANESTPNFKASNVEFESLFKDAIESQGNADKVTPSIVQNTNTVMREDGNNVDIDYENTQLAKNSLWYMTLSEKISDEFDMIDMAIKG